MNNKFSFSRFGQFANAELRADYKKYIMVILTVGIISVVSYIMGANARSFNIYAICQISLAAAYFGAIFNISRSFKKYFNSRTNAEAIMMPASKSEKFTYIYFCNVIGIPLVMYAMVFIIFVAASFIFEKNIYEIGNLFSKIDIIALFHIALFSVFFLGAVIFRKHQFILTCLSIGGVIILFSIFTVITGDWIFWRWISETAANYAVHNDWDTNMTIVSVIYRLSSLIMIFISVLFAWKKYNKIQTA